MLIEIALALFLGILFGIFTGLAPGIHTNLVSAVLLSLSSSLLLFFPPLALAVFIVSMSLTNSFLDFIPSIYLGAPDEDTALSVLPGHHLLLKGKGHEAILLSLIGALAGIVMLVFLIPLFILIVPKIYPFIERMMSYLLLLICILLLSRAKEKIPALIIFILAGFLGFLTLSLPLKQPLLCLLTGLFGSSTLIYSISQKTEIPKQKITELKIEKRKFIKPLLASSIVSPIVSFFPGMGNSEAAISGSALLVKLSRKQFLILLGSINTLTISLSFLALYTINKSRTGSAAAVSQLITLNFSSLLIIIASITFVSPLSSLIAIKISKLSAKNIHKFNYSKISLAVLLFLCIIVLFFSGFLGFLVFSVSTLLGLTCSYFNVRKGYLMSSLLLPTIFLYLPI